METHAERLKIKRGPCKTLEGLIGKIDTLHQLFTLTDLYGKEFITISYPNRFIPYMRQTKQGNLERPVITERDGVYVLEAFELHEQTKKREGK